MFKLSIIKTVNIDQVKYDRTFWRVWKHATNPKFFKEAVERFRHYANPVAYELAGVYYIINRYGSMEALIEMGKDEIDLDIIDLNQNDVIEFLLSFQYHEHKETRCMAELIMVTQEYTTTPEGKKWLKTITKSDDKEEQFSELFDISKHAAKCFLKLILPGNEKYLDKLAEDRNYRPSKAYSDCLAEEKKPDTTEDDVPDTGAGTQAGSTKFAAPGKGTPAGSSLDTTAGSGQPASSTDVSPSVPVTPELPASTEEYLNHLKQYEKGSSTPDDELPAQAIAQRVLVILSDGKQLELIGNIQLEVDGKNISNTGQLQPLPNGDWGLLPGFNDISLTLVAEGGSWANLQG